MTNQRTRWQESVGNYLRHNEPRRNKLIWITTNDDPTGFYTEHQARGILILDSGDVDEATESMQRAFRARHSVQIVAIEIMDEDVEEKPFYRLIQVINNHNCYSPTHEQVHLIIISNRSPNRTHWDVAHVSGWNKLNTITYANHSYGETYEHLVYPRRVPHGGLIWQ